MKLQYLGHSSFRIISEMGTTIVCDPYDSDFTGLNMPCVRCDVATISHHHGDHDYTQALSGSFAEIDAVLTFPADDIAIDSIETYHDDKKGSLRGKNIVFCFSVDGMRVVHLGDIGCLDENVVRFAKNCDVLLVPVGGTYTVDAQGPKWYVDAVCPNIVVPMHYKVPQLKFDLGTLQDFLNLFDAEQILVSDSDSLQLSDAPQYSQTKVIVLQKFQD